MLIGARKSILKSEDGMASIEIVPILLLFALLFNFTLGFFGVIHAGILNNIAARNYAFETFRNRPNLTYLRDVQPQGRTLAKEIESRYTRTGFRFHGIVSEVNPGLQWVATRRPIKFTDVQAGGVAETQGVSDEHMTLVRNIQSNGKVSDTFTGKTPDEGRSGVNPVWLQQLYGICLSSGCTPRKP